NGTGSAAIPSPPSTRTPLPDAVDTPSEASPERQGASPYGPYQELPESLRIYVVLPGDSLSSIAVRELGSASLAENIFLLNRDVIEDPDHLLAGVKIRLPVRESAIVDEPAPPDTTTPGRRPSMGLGRTHLVVRGDTLSSIAMQYYGTSAGWRFIYEANRNILPNPNVLAVGNELTIPPYEE
ncbi:MAG: LysM peptidoglycan-binding domain-containing protein, partial [Planctomycetaceae bacterium]|nr:LysM peptidoglycan-binding domain-containing protein [Planctomycetaceae bacterium]